MPDCGVCFTPFGNEQLACPVCGEAAKGNDPPPVDSTLKARKVLPFSGAGGPTVNPAPSHGTGTTAPAPSSGGPSVVASGGKTTPPIPVAPSAPATAGSLGNSALQSTRLNTNSGLTRWSPSPTLDGVVNGQVAADSRAMSRWPISALLLFAFGYLTVVVFLPLLLQVLAAIAFLFALIAIAQLFAGGSMIGGMVGGIFKVVEVGIRGVLFLFAGAAWSGHARPPLHVDATSFRLTDQAGKVYNCIALGQIPAGTIRTGDALIVNGFVWRDRSVRVRRIVNQRTGTTTRPRKPGSYWLIRACQVLVALIVVWSISLITN